MKARACRSFVVVKWMLVVALRSVFGHLVWFFLLSQGKKQARIGTCQLHEVWSTRAPLITKLLPSVDVSFHLFSVFVQVLSFPPSLYPLPFVTRPRLFNFLSAIHITSCEGMLKITRESKPFRQAHTQPFVWWLFLREMTAYSLVEPDLMCGGKSEAILSISASERALNNNLD